MSLQMQPGSMVPEETIRVAHGAFPKGNGYLTLRDELETIYTDRLFVSLFSQRGQPAESPGGLGMVSVLQFVEGLSDRQAADAVRSRMDWKYLLGLKLDDAGFDYSVLSEFRARILAGQIEQQLLDRLLERFRERGLLKARGKQRSDSTHVQAAIRNLNRLELVGETLSAALNAWAGIEPGWLKAHVGPEWYERYPTRFEQARLWESTTEFKERYAKRAGVEGTISQATRSCDLRRSRYIGQAKTHLQHLLIAIAIDLIRFVNWIREVPRATTRISAFAALAQIEL